MKTQLTALLARSGNYDLNLLADWFYEVYTKHLRILKTAREQKEQDEELSTDLVAKGLQSHATVVRLLDELLNLVFALDEVMATPAWGVKNARKKYAAGIMSGNDKLSLCLRICKALQKQRKQEGGDHVSVRV